MSMPSPFTFTKHGLSYRVELDAHYISDEEMQTLRRYITTLNDENAKLRELVKDMWQFTGAACKKYPRLFDQSAQGGQMVMPNMLDSFEQRMRELGVDDG